MTYKPVRSSKQFWSTPWRWGWYSQLLAVFFALVAGLFAWAMAAEVWR